MTRRALKVWCRRCDRSSYEVAFAWRSDSIRLHSWCRNCKRKYDREAARKKAA